jgi:tetratricopeptide (TPR) repeat protein
MKREPLIFFAFGIIFGFPLGYMIHSLGEGGVAGGVAAPPPSVQAASPEAATATAPTSAPQPLDPNEVKALESLAGREKGNARVRAELGNLLMDHGSFDDAVRWYQQSLDLEPKNDDVRVDMGVSLLNAGRSVEALTAFDTALKNTPGHKKALFNKGVALMSSGRPKEAVALWEDLIKRYPDDPQLRGLKQQIDQVRATLPGRSSS